MATTQNKHAIAAESYAADAKRQAEVAAERLEKLAATIRLHAGHLGKRPGTAASTAAEIVNVYTNGIGNPGTYLWGLVSNAATADREHDASLRD